MSQQDKKQKPDEARTGSLTSNGFLPGKTLLSSGATAIRLVRDRRASHPSLPSLSIGADTSRSTQFTGKKTGLPLYTPAQRLRRDASVWTLVQGILAPVQFLIFLISAGLLVRFLLTGEGLTVTTGSIVAKTLALYAIMITGAIWEKDVFGRYLFAPAFFWEDMVSMLVLALHTAYLFALVTDALDARARGFLALAAYATYIANATQFVLKLRAARLAGNDEDPDMLFAEMAQ